MIGKKIMELRKRRGYTLSMLAEKTNISKSYLSNIERNLNKNPSLNILLKIANVLNVEVKTLLKPNSTDECVKIEKEWVDFINELKDLGIDMNEVKQYKILLEFIKWQNQK
ncbi:helix-turn-helix domain-containing protein [Bacillus sp. JJ722]|uniref:helix-turn-helix domain-containing protein n=1 Tax=Bacillus sp. JJ722 TaxID=3122973 RepID=UPI00300093F7